MHYSQIMENIKEKCISCGRRPAEVKLIAVTKSRPIDAIQSIYHAGGRDFGESRVAEALEKIPLLPDDCRWHFIGTLQSNKVAKAIGAFALIHSVDTLALAQKISACSQSRQVTTSILLQVNTSGEETKHGLSPDEWENALPELNACSHLNIEGLMTMAPLTNDERIIRRCFQRLFELREKWRSRMKRPELFQHLSMGMSNDYLIAIEEGATLLRVGTALFSSYTEFLI